MYHLSDIANESGSWWSRPKGLTLVLTTLGISLALILLFLLSSKVASEQNAAVEPVSRSQRVTTQTQANSATPAATATTSADQNATPHTETTSKAISTTTASDSSVQVTVNGESVPVPENGSVRRTIQSADGQTTLDVSSSSDGESSNNSYSSLNVNLSSNSSSFSSNSSITIGGTTENN